MTIASWIVLGVVSVVLLCGIIRIFRWFCRSSHDD